MLAELFHRAPRAFGGAGDQRTAFVLRALVLGAAVVGLQSAEAQVAGIGDAAGQVHRVGSGGDAAAAGAGVDLHQHRQAHAGGGRGGLDRGDLRGIVGADRDPGDARQRGEAGELGRTHHFVAHEDVGHAGPGEDFRFRHFLHALADRAARHLQMGNHRGFVRLGVGAELRPGGGKQRFHVVQIGLERVEVEDQGRGVDLGFRGAGFGGGRLQHQLSFQGRRAASAAIQASAARWPRGVATSTRRRR